MLGLLGFLFLILFIVTVHEGGHLIAAKLFNVYCSEFSIGMGPELYRKKNLETDFVIRAIPIGGFCSMAGESEDGIEKRHEVDVPIERTIKGVAKWKQIIIYLAGVFMNFVSGFIIIVIAVMTISLTDVKVSQVIPNSPASSAFMVGDVLVEKNGVKIESLEDAYPDIGANSYKIIRNDEQMEKLIVISENNEAGFSVIHPHVSFVQALERAPEIFMNFATAIVEGLKSIFKEPQNLSGVVGIYSYTTEAVSEGWTVYLLLIAMISINVGVFNLLPLPVMDGGRVVIALGEIIMQKDIDKELEKKIMLVCAALLVLLMLWAFGMDIYRIIKGDIKLV